MASKGKKKRRWNGNGGKRKISVAVLGGLAIGMIDPIRWAMAGAPANGPEGWLDKLIRNYTGFTPSKAYYGKSWDFRFLAYGLLPFVGGALLHRLANKLGVNRALRGLPMVEI